eukprot:scaffold119619_cov61-Phaeocystis_antarctica.AAC.4
MPRVEMRSRSMLSRGSGCVVSGPRASSRSSPRLDSPCSSPGPFLSATAGRGARRHASPGAAEGGRGGESHASTPREAPCAMPRARRSAARSLDPAHRKRRSSRAAPPPWHRLRRRRPRRPAAAAAAAARGGASQRSAPADPPRPSV